MNGQAYTKPVPQLDAPEMAPFWTAAREHRLVAQQCRSCKAHQFPPLPICPACQEEDLEWVDVSQSGTIWSFAIYHRAFHPGFQDELPYVVALIENNERLTFPGRIMGPRQGLRVGARVRAKFVKCTDLFTLPAWELII